MRQMMRNRDGDGGVDGVWWLCHGSWCSLCVCTSETFWLLLVTNPRLGNDRWIQSTPFSKENNVYILTHAN